MDSDFDVLYMDGMITIRPFQCHWSHVQIQSDSLEIDETSQSLKTILVLQYRIGPLGLVPV
jgi:hypothetical protein